MDLQTILTTVESWSVEDRLRLIERIRDGLAAALPEEVGAPAEWADGTEVLDEATPSMRGRIGIEESQWRDDPEALADWDSWIKRIEPMDRVPEGRADPDRYEEEFRRYNVEAVRKQMEEGASG